MTDKENIERFILMRSQGWSFNRIQVELKISKPTLIKWSREHKMEIQNRRSMETEALAERIFGQRHQRWEIMARHSKSSKMKSRSAIWRRFRLPAAWHRRRAPCRDQRELENVGPCASREQRQHPQEDILAIHHQWEV